MPKRKQRTHCARGHEFTAENTGHRMCDGRPARYCKACAKARRAVYDRTHYQRMRARLAKQRRRLIPYAGAER